MKETTNFIGIVSCGTMFIVGIKYFLMSDNNIASFIGGIVCLLGLAGYIKCLD